ncbi:MAG: GTP-binding protein [Bacteriovoracaceae bacterium]|nr:GTP-binding protein [Bacteriovoracaceae bacterium]
MTTLNHKPQKRSMVVSLIGRPNVGKSSLFNRLMRRQHKAITHDVPGVTRDRHYGIASFDEKSDDVPAQDVILVDTGGFYPEKIDEKAETQDKQNANMFFNIMTDHAKKAIAESDLVLFVVDVREGILPFDKTIAKFIRQEKKEFWVVINKYDSDAQEGHEVDFYALGVDSDQMYVTSSAHGLGLDRLREQIQNASIVYNQTDIDSDGLQKGVTPREDVVSRLALIGAPNAGKSTLLNLLLGSQRALVSNVPGTTVDPIEGFFDLFFGEDAKKLVENTSRVQHDSVLVKQYEDFRKNNPDIYNTLVSSYQEDDRHDSDNLIEMDLEAEELNTNELLYEAVFEENCEKQEVAADNQEENEDEKGSHWRSIHIVDTAGIRKQNSIRGTIESESVYRSLRCITESDIILYMVDATKGISHQDRRLMDITIEKGKSLIVCLNKIDLMKEELTNNKEKQEWIQKLRDSIPWLGYCDLVPISAKQNTHIGNLKRSIKDTVTVRRRPIPGGILNRTIFDLVEKHPVVVAKSGGQRFKVKYTSMIKSDPPTFLMFTNKSKGIPDHFQRYLKNNIRREFEIRNTPVHLIFRTGTDLNKRLKKV